MTKNTKGTAHLYIPILIFVFIAGLGFYFLKSNKEEVNSTERQQENNTPSTSPTPTISENKTEDWKTYKNEIYGFEVMYYPELTPYETQGNDQLGQFTFLYQIEFGKPAIKSIYGYSLEVNQKKTLENYRQELVGHITDSIDSEQKVNVNTILWTKINYKMFLTTDYVQITKAVAENGEYGFAITASTNDIDQILSTFKFTDLECKEGEELKQCKVGPCCCPQGALCD